METYAVLTLAFSGIVMASTVVYAVLTWKLVEETRLLRKAQTAPQIGVYLRPSDGWVNIFDLVIENHGHGPAYNIKWTLGPDLHGNAKKTVDLDLLKSLDGLSYMAPGQRIQSFFGNAIKLLQQEPPPTILVSARYSDAQGNEYQSTYHLEPAKFRGMTRTGEDPKYTMAQALKDLAQAFRHLSRESYLQVLVKTNEELRLDKERMRQARDARRANDQNPHVPDQPSTES